MRQRRDRVGIGAVILQRCLVVVGRLKQTSREVVLIAVIGFILIGYAVAVGIIEEVRIGM